MGTMSRILVGLAALLATASGVSAQGTTGTVEGTVHAQGTGSLENVRVMVLGTTRGALTRSDGRYVITDVPAGDHQLRALRLGYAARVAAEKGLQIHIVRAEDLPQNPTELDAFAVLRQREAALSGLALLVESGTTDM